KKRTRLQEPEFSVVMLPPSPIGRMRPARNHLRFLSKFESSVEAGAERRPDQAAGARMPCGWKAHTASDPATAAATQEIQTGIAVPPTGIGTCIRARRAW